MSNFLPTEYQQYIHLSRYSRFNHEENRRETWSETVSRYFNFFDKHLQKQSENQTTMAGMFPQRFNFWNC